jgi:hypothetical protein
MRRFSRPFLISFVVVLGLLVAVGLALVLKKPVPAPSDDNDDDDDGQPGLVSPAAGSGQFDATFGSLAALVPQGGSAPVLTTPPPLAAADSAAQPAATAEAAPRHGAQFRDTAWVQAQDASAYTLQVLEAHSEDAAREFIAGQQQADQFRYFQISQNGQSSFVVIYGSYGGRDQASQAAPALAAETGLDSAPLVKNFGAFTAALPAATP